MPRARRPVRVNKSPPSFAPSKNGSAKKQQRAEQEIRPATILAVDIGGTKVKLLVNGQVEPRKLPSGRKMTPAKLVEAVRESTKDWTYEAVSIGYPGLVGQHGPRSDPGNLAPGWVGFNFAAAFERPVRIINDAAMQALGSYDGGRMLFLGFGTGLGSALIAEHLILPLELGRIAYGDKKTLGELLSRDGVKRLGKDEWRKIVSEVCAAFTDAFMVDYIVLGGGNAKVLKELPPGCRRGHNLTAFRGGFRLWSVDDVPTLDAESGHDEPVAPTAKTEWRVI